MARRKKQEAEEMRELRKKIASMKAIDPNYDSGNDVTLVVAEAKLKRGVDALEDSNKAVAIADDKDNILKDVVKDIRAFNKKILPAAGLKYGTDSSEYEQLGGTRDSDRKKPVRKPKADKDEDEDEDK